jgi:DNA-binding PucR family transcriptional regulator
MASGLPLAIGVSTAVSGFASVPDAYREAAAARLACGASHGVVALPSMSAFEYLTLREDPTASRLIAHPIHAFVEEDARDGGTLIATLREYVSSDLNARRAAANLHIHVNTAHYRLAKIAERTGSDLRRVTDLIELLIAARLADASTREAKSGVSTRGL